MSLWDALSPDDQHLLSEGVDGSMESVKGVKRKRKEETSLQVAAKKQVRALGQTLPKQSPLR